MVNNQNVTMPVVEPELTADETFHQVRIRKRCFCCDRDAAIDISRAAQQAASTPAAFEH